VALPSYSNHLISEKSPYLLQHAHNPVDWYPWGEEAFALSKKLDKPIFLSIGYATCHWCHVMERESFQDPHVAQTMNEAFVNIKVDREELPEVDSLYMEFAQLLMSTAGGWPLNVILTPELKPFFAITYLPPRTRHGLIGLEEFIAHIKQLWQSDERAELIEQANKIVEILERATHAIGDEVPQEDLLLDAVEHLFQLADPVYGGMKGEPKFPLGYQCNFLMQFAKAKNESRALFYVELTLDKMADGGIYDHLGGGFSRYSIDERWSIPHFEKMLYDNAILAGAYLAGWQFVKKERYRRVCEEILTYVLRDMTDPGGGFYSAEDADSEQHEGRFYTWTPDEIKEALPLSEAELFCRYYGVTPGGNFEGRSVLQIELPLNVFAEAQGLQEEELEQRLEEAKKILFERRTRREHPFKDDKILGGWNGLMIGALVKAGKALEEESFVHEALRAAECIRKNLWKEGQLLRRFRQGEARFPAGLDEYAYLLQGLLALFEAGCGTQWLSWGIEIAALLQKEFKREGGAFYQTEMQRSILIRKCEFYDGAEPSGNGLHAENLIRLFQITQNEDYLDQARDVFKAAKGFIEAYPPGACYHLLSLQHYLDETAPTLVISLDAQESFAEEMAVTIASHFCPHATVVWRREKDEELFLCIPSTRDQVPINGQTTLYICRKGVCEAPLSKKEEILKAITAL
jgi:uncharacterized protein